MVNAVDIWANDVADKLVKLGVEYHRVPGEEVRRWKAAFATARARAKWIGIATHAAGNHSQFPFRDSEASRWKAVAAQRKRTLIRRLGRGLQSSRLRWMQRRQSDRSRSRRRRQQRWQA